MIRAEADGRGNRAHVARARTVVALIAASVLAAACTGEGGGLASRTPSASRSGGVELPTISPSRSIGGGGLPTISPSRSAGGEQPSPEVSEAPSKTPEPTQEPKPSKTNEPKPSEEPQPTASETPPVEVTVTLSPQVTVTAVIVSPSGSGKGGGKKQPKEEEQSLGWLLLLLLIVAVVLGLVFASRRRRSGTEWTSLATNAYRSCSELRERLARELTETTGTPWTQLLPLADGAASTLYPLQTSPPDQQAALAVTHTVEAVSAVKLALQAGAGVPTPSDEAKASLLRALGQLDAALEPLRFEATGRSGPGPVTGPPTG
jgi:hypothetical protein